MRQGCELVRDIPDTYLLSASALQAVLLGVDVKGKRLVLEEVLLMSMLPLLP